MIKKDNSELSNGISNEKNDSEYHYKLIEDIQDENYYINIILDEKYELNIKEKALEKLSQINTYKIPFIVVNTKDEQIQKLACKYSHDNYFLYNLMKDKEYSNIHEDIVKFINDKNLLEDLLRYEEDFEKQYYIERKIHECNKNAIIQEENTNAYYFSNQNDENELKELCQEFYEKKKINIENPMDSCEYLLLNNNNMIRSSTIKRIEDEEFLQFIFLNAKDNNIRINALRQINNPYILNNILNNLKDYDFELKEYIFRQINDENIIYEILYEDRIFIPHPLENIKDENVLTNLILKHEDLIIENDFTFLNKIYKEANVKKIVSYSKNWRLRRKAFKKIKTQESYEYICYNTSFADMKISSVNMIKDKKILEKLARNMNDDYVQPVAYRKNRI